MDDSGAGNGIRLAYENGGTTNLLTLDYGDSADPAFRVYPDNGNNLTYVQMGRLTSSGPDGLQFVGPVGIYDENANYSIDVNARVLYKSDGVVQVYDWENNIIDTEDAADPLKIDAGTGGDVLRFLQDSGEDIIFNYGPDGLLLMGSDSEGVDLQILDNTGAGNNLMTLRGIDGVESYGALTSIHNIIIAPNSGAIASSSDAPFWFEYNNGLSEYNFWIGGNVPARISNSNTGVLTLEGSGYVLNNLTTNGFLTTTAGDGTLAVDPIIITSGTYTPTLTSVTNVAASSSFLTNYMRVGGSMTISGQLTIDPTAVGNTVIRMSLPIASNFGANEDCGGVFANNTIDQSGGIYADPTTDLIEFKMNAASATNQGFHFTLTCRIV